MGAPRLSCNISRSDLLFWWDNLPRIESSCVARKSDVVHDTGMAKIKYRVQGTKVTELVNNVDQTFNTFAAAMKTRDFLRELGYRATVQTVTLFEGGS